ncbi:modification methylase, partial [Listeria monocytogenes]|nr:modification methylase [Listeria monocytogenes]
EKLFVLHMYSFQNMIRFNNNQKFNTPIGVAGISDDLINRMNEFVPRTSKIELINKDYAQIDFSQFPKDSVFYFDPPYYITSAAYNDGKRGMKGWNSEAETELLDILTKMDKNGYKFILSNVIKHKEKTNHILKEWIQEHDFIVHEVGVSGWRYAKDEVIIKNYEE